MFQGTIRHESVRLRRQIQAINNLGKLSIGFVTNKRDLETLDNVLGEKTIYLSRK